MEVAGPRLTGNAPIWCKRVVRAAAISSLEDFEEEKGNTGGGVEESVTTDTSIGATASKNRSPNPKKRTIEKLVVTQEVVVNINKDSGDVEKSVAADTSIEEVTLGNRSPNPKKRAIEKLVVSQEVVVDGNKGCSTSPKEEKEEVSEGNKPSTETKKAAVGNGSSHFINSEAKSGHIVDWVSPIKRDNKKRVLIVTPNDSVEEYLHNCLRENECIVVAGVNRAEDIESDCDMVCIDCSALGLKGGLYFRRRIVMKHQKRKLITLAVVMDDALRKAHPHAIRVLCETFTGICILPASEEDV